jgi:ABC-type multidrug transport system fused ATPase/permease subunit
MLNVKAGSARAVVLERRQIVEIGRHEELLAKKRRYHALVHAESA